MQISILDLLNTQNVTKSEHTVSNNARKVERPMSAYERTKAQVYATGNKWAIENFHATHD